MFRLTFIPFTVIMDSCHDSTLFRQQLFFHIIHLVSIKGSKQLPFFWMDGFLVYSLGALLVHCEIT